MTTICCTQVKIIHNWTQFGVLGTFALCCAKSIYGLSTQPLRQGSHFGSDKIWMSQEPPPPTEGLKRPFGPNTVGRSAGCPIDIIVFCAQVSQMRHSFCSDVETRDKGKGGGRLLTAVAPALLLVFDSCCISWCKRCTHVERRLRFVSLMAKMCTVPLSLDTHRNDESALKFILQSTG